MKSNKEKVQKLISAAKTHLDEALLKLEDVSSLDKHSLGFAAHALGNYLTVIEGTVELLKISLKDYPDEQVHSWLEGLKHTSALMMHTSHQLMGTSIEGDPHLAFAEVDLPTLTERICDFYQTKANRKNLKIKIEINVSNPHVRTDRVALAAVLDNLLSNAVKYSQKGKKIFIRVNQKVDELIWSICDQGPGIPPEEEAQLFQKGKKLSTLPSGKENSTGYGLSVAKYLIEQLNGKIWFERNAEGGSCFSVSLPLVKE
jgi:signal transduction histidine kinase